jgi:hypothetical protein
VAERLSFHSPVSIISTTPCPSPAAPDLTEEKSEMTETFAETMSEPALAVTHFSLPSLSETRSVTADTNDEEELKKILDKMEAMFSPEKDSNGNDSISSL